MGKKLTSSVIWVFVLVLAVGAGGLSTGCCDVDSPRCGCFDDEGDWNPSGASIQAIAHATVGTRESCVADGGKPYYQMKLGIDDPELAETAACVLRMVESMFPWVAEIEVLKRDAWCSETISYWHREAGIPYPTGYRGGGILDWVLPNTYAIQSFYESEELAGGRGRWIGWDELSYEDFRLGETAPLPGAYVLIRRYDPITHRWEGESHSLMVDTMVVYRTAGGEVSRVRVSLLEGNSDDEVRSGAVFDDVLALTPAGDKWIGSGRKIVGFGIDLDSSGQPIYDRTRLYTVRTLSGRAVDARHPKVHDPIWESYFEKLVHSLAGYEKLVRRGIRVRSEGLKAAGIPDGRVKWTIPAATAASVEIDLLAVHPVPIRGLLLVWEGGPPRGYRVEWAGGDHRFRPAQVPALSSDALPQKGWYPIPVSFGKGSVGVRYVRFYFPASPAAAVLREVRFIHDWDGQEDAKRP